MPFRAILAGLLAHHAARVRGAVFCDEEGERVESLINDAALDAYDLDLCGASYASVAAMVASSELVARDGEAGCGFGALRIRVLHPGAVVWLQGLARGYYLVVLTARDGRDATIEPVLDEVAEALIAHM